jgi:hypothetical protein
MPFPVTIAFEEQEIDNRDEKLVVWLRLCEFFRFFV